MRTCYAGPGSECQCVDRSELIGALLDAETKLHGIENLVKLYERHMENNVWLSSFIPDLRKILDEQ